MELKECKAIINVSLGAHFKCFSWRLLILERFFSIETWVTLSNHANFLHHHIIFHGLFNAEEISIRESV